MSKCQRSPRSTDQAKDHCGPHALDTPTLPRTSIPSHTGHNSNQLWKPPISKHGTKITFDPQGSKLIEGTRNEQKAEGF